MMKNKKELSEKELIEICSKHYYLITDRKFLEKVKISIAKPIKKKIKATFPVGMQFLKKNKKYFTGDLMSDTDHSKYTLLTFQKLSIESRYNYEQLIVRFHFIDENFKKVLSCWYATKPITEFLYQDFVQELYDDLALDFKILK